MLSCLGRDEKGKFHISYIAENSVIIDFETFVAFWGCLKIQSDWIVMSNWGVLGDISYEIKTLFKIWIVSIIWESFSEKLQVLKAFNRSLEKKCRKYVENYKKY